MNRVLAFDMGASSGRAMLGEFDGEKIKITELHRFQNDPVQVFGTLYWDTLRLFFDIKKGISAAVHAGGFDSLAIDTWGVDFGLIGGDGQPVSIPVHYRDNRTDGYRDFAVPTDDMYMSTGIQDMQINTVYQLDYLVKHKPEQLEATDKMLFTPDLLNYFLCGQKKTEYTIASTASLLDAKKRDWDWELIDKLNIPSNIFCDIVMPGTQCGVLTEEIQEELQAPAAKVVCIGSHDTASAVASVPTQEKDFIYISSGTWSLLGTETPEPIINEKALKYNCTNEGGVGGMIRFLKNIMGTWLIQESRRQWIREGNEYSFGELEGMARECEPFRCFIDVDHPDFIKAGNMPRRIKAFCERTGQYVPQTPGEVVRCIDESLALKYRYAISCIADCTGREYKTINIVGGGVNSKLLCQMAADASGMKVIAGPSEATVFGNVAVQLMAQGVLKDLAEVRRVVANSVETEEYLPVGTEKWDGAYKKFIETIIG